MSTIPLLRPAATEEEVQAVAEVIRSGWWGQGPKCEEFEAEFAARYGLPTEQCVTVNSATAALHLAMLVLGVGAGDEVITTALTFISSALCASYVGAKPIFADIDTRTLCLDWESVRRKVTKKTKAVVAVDYAGYPCEPDVETLAWLHDRDIVVVQDAAHSAGGLFWGDLATYSFHPVKNLAMGDGGALLTRDIVTARRLRALRWCGINRSTWERTTKRYNWDYDIDEIGYKYHLNDIQAAIGLVQLHNLTTHNQRRRELAECYRNALGQFYELPPDHPQHTWHLYALRVPPEERDRLLDYLLGQGISVGVHYKPLTYYPLFGGQTTPPITEYTWRRLLSLPMYPEMTDVTQMRVIQALKT